MDSSVLRGFEGRRGFECAGSAWIPVCGVDSMMSVGSSVGVDSSVQRGIEGQSGFQGERWFDGRRGFKGRRGFECVALVRWSVWIRG